MIRLPREDLRRFRTLLRRCLPPRSTEATPPVRLSTRQGQLALLATHNTIRLGYTLNQSGPEEQHDLPGELLDLAERTSTEELTLQPLSPGRWQCSWTSTSTSGPGEHWFEETPITGLDWPSRPKRWGPVSGTVLPGLSAASRIACQQSSRWATHCLQLQGREGRLVATDNRQVLIQTGIRWPFEQTMLIPALPVYSAREWQQAPVRLALVEDELQFSIESWWLAVPLDQDGRFPDAVSVVPRSVNPTKVQLSEPDARRILEQLAACKSAEYPRVTIEVQPPVVSIRLGGDDARPVREIPLNPSTVSGPGTQVTLECQYLQRGLQLGLRNLQLIAPEKPLLMLDDQRQYVVSTLHPSVAIPADQPMIATLDRASSREQSPLSPLVLPQESTVPPSRSINESGPIDRDPVAEAEAVRGLLQEATLRLTQLVQLLKDRRKTDRAISQVVRSIQALPRPERS